MLIEDMVSLRKERKDLEKSGCCVIVTSEISAKCLFEKRFEIELTGSESNRELRESQQNCQRAQGALPIRSFGYRA